MVIVRKDVLRLLALARIEVPAEEVEKMERDLENILNYFLELEEVPVEGVLPMSGGMLHENAYRRDEKGPSLSTLPADLARAFPEEEGGYLRVPPVFE